MSRHARVLAAALVGSALLLVIGALWLSAQVVAAVGAAALLLCAVGCLRIARRVDDSRAWAEVSLLHGMLRERDALWTAVPAPLAMWDAEDEPVMASTAWQALGLSARTPPAQPEVLVGDPARTFMAETSTLAGGGRLVLLREVTFEREALRAKDELLAVVGHELRTPLSSIKGYGQLMARQLATVQEQVQRLDQLAGDVMDTARADGGRLTLRREEHSVAELIHSAAGRFRAANPTRIVELDLQQPCPSIEGDAGRLGQVLDNLLSNAAKYSPPETVISVRAEPDGNWVRIAVTDRGQGIPHEHLTRLFDRFYRVPTAEKGSPDGFGLGLSIVRDLVEAHGGTVEVASAGPGKGATFTVVLPRLTPAP